jgi:hypothetical protein
MANHPGADIQVYRTYTDYLNGKSEKMDDLKRYLSSRIINIGDMIYFGGDKITLVFILKGEKIKIKCEDIWGFSLNKRLYRIDHTYEQPVALVDSGKLFYYENGLSYLNAFLRDADYITSSNVGNYSEIGKATGNVAYLSQTLNSDIVPLFCAVTIPDAINLAHTGARKKYHKYIKDYPMHQSFYDCMEKSKGSERDNYPILDIRNCIINYIGYPKNDSIPEYR